MPSRVDLVSYPTLRDSARRVGHPRLAVTVFAWRVVDDVADIQRPVSPGAPSEAAAWAVTEVNDRHEAGGSRLPGRGHGLGYVLFPGFNWDCRCQG